MNTGSGWEQKSIMQGCPFIFMIRRENSRNNQIVGRKTTLRLRTSFRKPQAVTLSSLAWRHRQQPARIGRWCTVSGRFGQVVSLLRSVARVRVAESFRGCSVNPECKIETVGSFFVGRSAPVCVLQPSKEVPSPLQVRFGCQTDVLCACAAFVLGSSPLKILNRADVTTVIATQVCSGSCQA